jgi:hypothetical protein
MPTRRARSLLLPLCAVAAGLLAMAAAGSQEAPKSKPELVLTANPAVAFTPARVKFTAALLEGRDDYEEFYCASIEWDWDDGTVSQWTRDCQPYKAVRSKIQRQFSAVHTYDVPDNYQPTFRLKKREKVVAQMRTSIEVRAGGPNED